MLVELTIENLAIIDRLQIAFSAGFNVLTGETGTGKSIIIDAVSLLLGGRASTDMIRTGCDAAAVEGLFELSADSSAALVAELAELGLEIEEGQLILRREMSRERRNVCRVNRRAVTLSALQSLGRHLVDIHGQGDQLSLLQVRNHVGFLDRYGVLTDERQAFAAQFGRLRQVRSELNALHRDAREVARREDLLKYQSDEIEAAHLDPGEEDELRRERSLLANAEKLLELAARIYEGLVSGEGKQRSIIDLLGAVLDDLNALAKLDEARQADLQMVESAYYQLEDLGRSYRSYRDTLEYDPARLERVEERIDLIQGLKRKYGESIEEVLAYGQRARAELETISHSTERVTELEAAEQALLATLAQQGAELSAHRREAAQRLSQAVEAELATLGMARARFLVDIAWAEGEGGLPLRGKRYAFDADGLDHVEFLIAPNPGEDPKSLAKTASGGETSRLMLAMKNVLSAADPVPTLIFDEIDAGIGGKTGHVVGEALRKLAHQHQVFCVTHLAQIASKADRHLRVTKDVVGQRTLSSIQALSSNERIEELAVMLAGAATDSSRRNAEELIRQAAHGAQAEQEKT